MKTTTLLYAALVTSSLLTACGPRIQNSPDLSISSQDQNIVGGEAVASDNEIARHTVALAHPLYGVFCSATLIAKNLVLTAGHCTGMTRDPRQLIVVFSATPQAATRAQTRRVLGGKTTDNWPKLQADQQKNWGDIAVLRFEGVAPAGFEPAPILGNPGPLKNGMEVTLAGYGLTSMQPETDPGKLMATSVKLSNAQYSETELSFEQDQGKGACHGDSGGPAYAMVKGRMTLIGVTSRALTEAGGRTCLEGSVYTSVAAHRSFLVATAKFLNSREFKAGEPIPQPQE